MLFIGNYYEPNSINGGFVYMFPTNATQQVLHKLVEEIVNLAVHTQGLLNKDEVPEKENDQVYLSKLVREEYAGLKYFVLPYSYFPDGVWYTMTKEKKNNRYIHLLYIMIMCPEMKKTIIESNNLDIGF